MTCQNCKNEIADNLSVCPSCGAPVNTAPLSPGPVSPAPMNDGMVYPTTPPATTPTQSPYNPWLQMKRIFSVAIAVVSGLSFVLALITLIAGMASSPSTVGAFANISRVVLMFAGWVAALSFWIGLIACIVFIVLSKGNSVNKEYYKRNRLWVFLGPLLLVITIVVWFVIVSIISNFFRL